MRIRFVTLYFPPEVGAAQRRISELAYRLAGRGHEVTILTGFPNYPSGIKPPEYRRKLFMKEKRENYTIVRVPHYVAANKGFLKRLMIHLTFAFSASVHSLFMKRDDIIYLESPPLFNGFVGFSTKIVRRIPYLFNVADLWPQTAVELGALKNRWLIASAQFLERFFYNQSSGILAVTAGIQNFIIEMGYDKSKVSLISNGVDHTVFTDAVVPDETLADYRKDGCLLAMYAGTHGMAHALAVIVAATEQLQQEPIRFLFIGDGPEKPLLQKTVAQKHLKNVFFLDPVPSSSMPGVWKAADIAIISLKNLPLFDSAMPSKCFEAMASGVPIMLAVRGEMAGHITQARCGFTAEPEEVDQIVNAFKRFLVLTAEERTTMGRRGREYVIKHFSRQAIVNRLEATMKEVVERG